MGEEEKVGGGEDEDEQKKNLVCNNLIFADTRMTYAEPGSEITAGVIRLVQLQALEVNCSWQLSSR